MIEEIYLPKWLSCKKRLKFEEVSEEELRVAECPDKWECYGCDPTGCIIKKDWLILKEVKEVSTMDSEAHPNMDLDNLWFTDEEIKKIIEPYEKRIETFYYQRSLVCDLDTITIYRLKGLGEKDDD